VGRAKAKPTTTSSKCPTQAPNWGLFLIPKAEALDSKKSKASALDSKKKPKLSENQWNQTQLIHSILYG
jgi:hypothetical protein